MQRLFLLLSLEDLLTIELKSAVWVTVTIAVGSGKILSIEDINTKLTHVVDALAWIELHFDWNVL